MERIDKRNILLLNCSTASMTGSHHNAGESLIVELNLALQERSAGCLVLADAASRKARQDQEQGAQVTSAGHG
jgi:hypothetical protein